MTLAADPRSLHGAVAAGILGAGPVILGTSDACAQLLEDTQEKVAAGGELAAVARDVARAIRASGGQGAGVRSSRARPARPARRADPRARRRPRGERAPRPARASPPRRRRRGLGQAAHAERRHAHRGGPLDLGLPRTWWRPSRFSRAAGLLAHLAEERVEPSVSCSRPGRRRRSSTSGRENPSDPIGGRGPPVGPSSTPSTMRPTARSSYLYERPALPREAGGGRIRIRRGAGGLAEIARLPVTEKRELKAMHAREPDRGAPLRDARRDRPIYSTKAAPPARPATPPMAGDLDTAPRRPEATRPQASPPGSASCPRTTPGPLPPGRSPPSSGSASRTSRSGPGTPSASSGRSSS